MSKARKESKKVLKSFEDLKEGMKVYIKDDLRGGVRYGENRWFSVMAKGIVEFDDFEPEDRVSPRTERKYKDRYRYTDEMIDWDKTNKLNAPSKGKKGEIEMTKEEFFKRYKGDDLAVLCDSKEKSDEFLRLAEKFGVRWSGGEKLSEEKFSRGRHAKGVYYTIWHDNKLTHGRLFNDEVVEFELPLVTLSESNKSTQSNFIKLPQVKVINSESDSHLLFGTFIQIGEEMVSYVEGNSVGTSYCHPDDQFNLEIGKALAYYRWAKGE